MDKKQAVFCFAAVFLILITLLVSMNSSLIFAAEEVQINTTQETQQVNKAYTWLGDEVRDSWEPLGVEDNALALLALAWDDNLASQGLSALNSKSKDGDNECWPSSCKVKETALAMLALSNIGRNTEKPQEWLMEQNGTPSELKWYMQIESAEEATCTVSYNQDEREYTIVLDEDKKINKAAGSCLTLSYGNYWLKVSQSCYEKKFTISCDKDFIANLFYQRPGVTTIYLSSDTKRESAGGYAELKISSICLEESGICNYEATAWAAAAMLKSRDISVFTPYLVAYAEKNPELMPEAFLYMLTGQEDYAKEIVSKQKRQGYWEAGSSYGRYYDTALVLFALENYDAEGKNKAKEWLLSHQVSSGVDGGSWQGSKKDTSFILHAVWPKEATYIPEEKLYCTDYGYYCLPSYDCDFDLRITDYYCSGMQLCCKSKPEEKTRTCNEMGGLKCSGAETCIGTSTSASDGICCLGACRKEEVNECEEEDYTCRYYCGEEEEEVDFECSGTKVCCAAKIAEAEKRSKAWILWLLLIVALGAAGFIFREKITEQFSRFGKGSPARKPKPRFPPAGGTGRQSIRPVGPPARAAPSRPSILNRFALKKTSHDKELEETLKKLREEGR